MVTSIRVYEDTIDIYRRYLLESKADILIVNFIRMILDIERLDLIVYTRD
jgi:hypothetical protein